ncbi:multiprotein-bridging factor 1 family protein [Tianweitania populi]|uniref:Transcriptional regulator n=1 Tax=Tianweitania populi TaxID=1607949 RepID=A0A8J3GLA6_9HYPH|nr:helix-turn-helix transcriptional regulator [Tianweitania populi]GHD20781.1 transcriptional regulator [Tianweitania populi]
MNAVAADEDSQLTSDQVRAARALLQWDQKKLAEKSGVSLATIKRLEPVSGPIKANRVTIAALKRCLQEAGIEFIDENGGGVGVRLRSPKKL